MQSEDWIARNWRPLVALGLFATILFYVLIEPILHFWFGVPMVNPAVKDLDQVYQLSAVCLTGYGAVRTIEKIAERWIGRK
jgi:hypothetical protein